MADVTLKSGRVIHVDVTAVTVREWRRFIDPKGKPEEENALVAVLADHVDVSGDGTVVSVVACPHCRAQIERLDHYFFQFGKVKGFG